MPGSGAPGPRYGFGYGWLPLELGWGDAFNKINHDMNILLHPYVLNMLLTAPPGAPVDGDMYVPFAGATGAWAGHADELAIWWNGAWEFFTPLKGIRVRDADRSAFYWWDGLAWMAE